MKNKSQTQPQKRIFRMENIAILSGLVVVVLLAMYQFTPTGSATGTLNGGFSLIKPTLYQEKVASQPHFLIDVRTPEEFSSGHIAGAVNIPVTSLESALSQVPRDVPVVVYCRSGNRSASASRILQNAGYSTVYDLGGIMEWTNSGYPLQ